MSPSARTLAALRRAGWFVDTVERWVKFNRGGGCRRDLFHGIDQVAVKAGVGILGVQSTDKTNIAARVRKLTDPTTTDHDARVAWVEAGGRLEVWGWSPGRRDPDVRRLVASGGRLAAVEEVRPPLPSIAPVHQRRPKTPRPKRVLVPARRKQRTPAS